MGKNINENKKDEDNISPTSSTTLALPTIKDSEGNEKGDIKINGDSTNENKDQNTVDMGDLEKGENNEETSKNSNNDNKNKNENIVDGDDERNNKNNTFDDSNRNKESEGNDGDDRNDKDNMNEIMDDTNDDVDRKIGDNN